MLTRDVMRTAIKVAHAQQTVRESVEVMESAGIGCLPIVDDGEAVGMLTDCDIAVRVVACGRDPMVARVGEVMTGRFISCRNDQDVNEVLELMLKENVRRLPIVSPHGHGLCGIVSLNDGAAAALGSEFVGMIVAAGAKAPERAP
jgi:CBS domain-containing protein